MLATHPTEELIFEPEDLHCLKCDKSLKANCKCNIGFRYYPPEKQRLKAISIHPDDSDALIEAKQARSNQFH